MNARTDVQAAPPDDGGHQGSFTRPQDVMTDPSIGDRETPSPPMHHNAVSRPRHSPSWVGVLIVLACLALGIFFGIVPRWSGE